MIQTEEGQLLLKTTDFKFVRTQEDVITIRLYEVMAGEESYKYIAGPAVATETRLAKKEFYDQGVTQEEALQDCINKIKNVDRDSLFDKPRPMLPPSSVGVF